MDLGEILRLIAKRWYVAFPSLMLGAALPAAAYTSIPTKFQSQSTLSLLNSSAASDVAPHLGNPFLSFDSSLTPTADFLARRLSTSQAAQDLLALGVTEETSAKLADNASGPFVTLTMTGTDKAHTMQSMQIFDKYAADQLQQMQTAGVGNLPTDSLIRSVVIVAPQDPVPQMKSKYEAVAGAGAAGVVLAFLAVFGYDNIATRRTVKQGPGPAGGRSRRAADVEDEFDDETEAESAAVPAPPAKDAKKKAGQSKPSEDGLRRRPSSGSDSSSGLRVRSRSGDAGVPDEAAPAPSSRTEPPPFDFEAELGRSFEAGARSAAETQQLSLDAIKRAGASEDLGWFPRLDDMDIDHMDGLGDLAVADRESDKS
jgi:hypothetical protein